MENLSKLLDNLILICDQEIELFKLNNIDQLDLLSIQKNNLVQDLLQNQNILTVKNISPDIKNKFTILLSKLKNNSELFNYKFNLLNNFLSSQNSLTYMQNKTVNSYNKINLSV